MLKKAWYRRREKRWVGDSEVRSTGTFRFSVVRRLGSSGGKGPDMLVLIRRVLNEWVIVILCGITARITFQLNIVMATHGESDFTESSEQQYNNITGTVTVGMTVKSQIQIALSNILKDSLDLQRTLQRLLIQF